MKSRIPALMTFVGVVACGSTALWWLWTGSQAAVPKPANEVAEQSDETAAGPDRIVLPEGKAKVLELRLAEVTRRRLQPTSTVPARLQYDDRRHVEVRVAAPGILTDVLVRPGDHVEAGQVLAVVSSPEVGREVDPQTNAVPLIAEVENRDGLLRPGMFTQATIPTRDAIETLAVPSSAIVEHEGATFVFVPQGDREYQRLGIITGRRAGQFVEVVSGLSEGQQVVASDAFYLKSELLLEGEE